MLPKAFTEEEEEDENTIIYIDKTKWFLCKSVRHRPFSSFRLSHFFFLLLFICAGLHFSNTCNLLLLDICEFNGGTFFFCKSESLFHRCPLAKDRENENKEEVEDWHNHFQ